MDKSYLEIEGGEVLPGLTYAERLAYDERALQFRSPLVARKAQRAIEDLPLFGGERQEELF
jgi:hypothetical protein